MMGSSMSRSRDLPIAIIGAGFSGLCTAMQLRKAGFDSFTMFEAGNDLGGTWRDNTYPVCMCYVPSPFYSFSFEPNLRWSRMYSPQPEILEYLRRCANKYGLIPQLRLNTYIKSARFDQDRSIWVLQSEKGEI